jgi:hypothetical protein
MVERSTFVLGVAGVLGGLLFILIVYFLHKFKRRLPGRNRVVPLIPNDAVETVTVPVVSKWHRSMETARSMRKDAVKRILRRSIVEILRISGVILVLIYTASSWGFSSSSASVRDFQSSSAVFVVIPLLLLDFAIIGVTAINWKRYYLEQKVAYGLYCVFLGFPCGTATKIIVSLQNSGVSLPDWVVFTPLAVVFELTALVVLLYFTWCGCLCGRREQCRERPGCACFVTGIIVLVIVFTFSVLLVAALHYTWPDTVPVQRDAFKTLEGLTSTWTGRLLPVWIILSVLFLIGTGSLFNNLLYGRFNRVVCMMPDLFLFYGYSSFVLLAAYEASYQGSFTSALQLYLPIIIGELFCQSALILPAVLAYMKEKHWKTKIGYASSMVDKLPPSEWNTSAVSWWLTEVMGMGNCAVICEREIVTGRRLQEMSKFDLDQLGIKGSVDRKRLKMSLLLLSLDRNDGHSVICDMVDPWNEADEQLKRRLLSISSVWIQNTWLSDLGLSHLKKKFQFSSIDGTLLFLLNKDDLATTTSLGIQSETDRESLLAGRELLSLCQYNTDVLNKLRTTKISGIDKKPIVLWSNHDVLGEFETLPLDSATGLHGAYILHPHFHPRNILSNLGSQASTAMLDKLCQALQEMTNSVADMTKSRTCINQSESSSQNSGQPNKGTRTENAIQTVDREIERDEQEFLELRGILTLLFAHYRENCLQKLTICRNFQDSLIQFRPRPLSRARLPPIITDINTVSPPAYWTAYKGDLRSYSTREWKVLQVEGPLFSIISKHMTDTWAVDGNSLSQNPYQNCCIENIQRIENPGVFCQYQTRVSSLVKEGEDTVFVSPEPPMRSIDGDLEGYAQLRARINECYMWHRAQTELIDSICQKGLNNLISTEDTVSTTTYFKFSDKSSSHYHQTTGRRLIRMSLVNWAEASQIVQKQTESTTTLTDGHNCN